MPWFHWHRQHIYPQNSKDTLMRKVNALSITDNGIMRICVSVSDLQKSCDFFVHELDLTEVCHGFFDKNTVKKLYGINSRAEYVMLKNDVQPTLLELLYLENSPKNEIRNGRPSWDFGYYDIAFRAKDNTQSMKHFKDAGYTYFCEPVHYTADWINLDVLEGVLRGPDCIPLAMIERLKEPIPVFDGNFSIFTDSAVTLEDAEETIRFYTEVIGLTKTFDEVLPDGLVDEVVSVPNGTHTRMLMFSGGNTPITECLVYSKKGVPMSDVATPENVGIFAMAYETDNLQALLERANANGFHTTNGPVQVELAPYGRIELAHISGPSDIMVEVFQIL